MSKKYLKLSGFCKIQDIIFIKPYISVNGVKIKSIFIQSLMKEFVCIGANRKTATGKRIKNHIILYVRNASSLFL